MASAGGNETRRCRSEGGFSGRCEARLFSESRHGCSQSLPCVSPPPPPDKPSCSLRGSLGLSGGFGGWERDEALPFRGRLFGTRRGTAVLRVYLIVQSGVYDRIHFILDHVAISLISIEYIFQNCALLCSVFFIACAHHYPQRYTVMNFIHKTWMSYDHTLNVKDCLVSSVFSNIIDNTVNVYKFSKLVCWHQIRREQNREQERF